MRRYFLQELANAFVDYIRNPESDETQARALNAYLSAEEIGYPRSQLEQVCNNIGKIICPANNECNYCHARLEVLRETIESTVFICPDCHRTFLFEDGIQTTF